MITQKQVKKLFNYNPNTGVLTNRLDRSYRSKTGFVVGGLNSGIYLRTKISGKNHTVHRIVFLFHHGYLPEEVDHIDGDKLNNKIKNLRAATRGENKQNSKTQKNNALGLKGVSWCKINRKYVARIMSNKKIIHLGYFNDPEVADQITRIARIHYHGEFANHG